MTIGIIGSVLIIIAGFLMQIAIFPAFGATTVGPNMIMSLTVVFAMIFGPWPALAMGFFGGMLVDSIAGSTMAISSLIPIIVGFTIGMLRGDLNSRHFVWAMIYAALAHILNDFWMMSALYFGRITLNINFATLARIIFSAIETGLFAGLIFIILTKLLIIGEKRGGLPYLQRY